MPPIFSKMNQSDWPAAPSDAPFKAIVPNGVARDKGRNPQEQNDSNERTTDATGGGWRGNRTGE